MSRRRSSSDENPFAIAEKYYSNGKFRARTYSVYDPKPNSVFGSPSPNSSQEQLTARSGDSQPDATPPPRRPSIYQVADDLLLQSISSPPPPKFLPVSNHYRRASLDETIFVPQKYYIGNVDMTLNELLENEDTDHNYQITIDDTGPKVLKLGTANSNGYKSSVVRGNYMLSNLLQELTIAKSMGRNLIILDEERLRENPVHRMKRLITTQFWKNLTRRVTEDNIGDMAEDTKIQEDYVDDHGSHHTAKQTHRIYVPYDRSDQYEYFVAAKAKNPDLDVQYLPREFDADYILSLNKKPGLLALPTKPQQEPQEGPQLLVHWPYVVPGGRFNELYGWDSYMIAVGLLTEASAHPEHLELARGMTESFIYEIQHYGKILNANRSYYLGRSQPPFLTDMALRVFDKTLELDPGSPDILDFLRRAIEAAIKEYETVWVAEPRLDRETGLSCYHPVGKGVPPETESSQFNVILTPYSEKYNISQKEFIERYNSGDIKEPELDLYFLHDRGIRESGHDTSYRLEGKCAYLATVDLNSLLYKYEIDIAHSIKTHFGNKLETQGKVHTSELWLQRAEQRKANISHYLWNEDDSIFYDYHIKEKQQTRYESVTSLWPLWSRAATDHQASKLVENSVSKFEEFGGLVSGTLKSRGEINIHRPPRQWDYPYGWAPQQILAWIGLCNYHYEGIARRLAYRWLYLVTKAFVDYNGVVVEKYNMVKGAVPHKVDAEYGNQGLNFKGVAREGFGWVNASYLLALTLMKPHAVSALDTLTPPEDFLSNLHPSQRALYK